MAKKVESTAKQDERLKLTPEVIKEFERLNGQLQSFYDEMSTLSKKSPDGAVNKFKLKFINGTLKEATAFLGDMYRPFKDFEVFSEDELPTSSDVGMMLSQYLTGMQRFKQAHTYSEGIQTFWRSTTADKLWAGR